MLASCSKIFDFSVFEVLNITNMSSAQVTELHIRPHSGLSSGPRSSAMPSVSSKGGRRKLVRPSTAPATRPSFMDQKNKGKSPKKSFRLNIRAIMNVDGGKRPENMVSVLLRRVRKQVALAKEEYDRTHFKVAERKRQLVRLKLKMRDLKRDGSALGVEDANDGERLKPVVSISKRPVYTKHTRIHKMQQKLDRDKMKYDKAVLTGEVYKHTLERMLRDRTMLEKKNRDLKTFVEKKGIRIHEQNRDVHYFDDSLVQATAQLEILKNEVATDMKLWDDTIAEREEWVKKKRLFEKSYEESLKRQKHVPLNAFPHPQDKRVRDHGKELTSEKQTRRKRILEACKNAKLPVDLKHPCKLARMCVGFSHLLAELEEEKSALAARFDELSHKRDFLEVSVDAIEAQKAKCESDGVRDMPSNVRSGFEILLQKLVREKYHWYPESSNDVADAVASIKQRIEELKASADEKDTDFTSTKFLDALPDSNIRVNAAFSDNGAALTAAETFVESLMQRWS